MSSADRRPPCPWDEEPMRILLTGCAGFIGWKVAQVDILQSPGLPTGG